MVIQNMLVQERAAVAAAVHGAAARRARAVLLVPSLVDVPDDLRAAVLAELAVRVHLGEHVLRRAAAEVSDRLVAAPTLLIYTSTAFRACGMSVIALKNRGINRSIKSSSEIIEKKIGGSSACKELL